MGDPSKDRDWQTRYKRIGLNYEFWKQKVEHVRALRNSYGVAHYDLDDKKLDQELAVAVETAKTVIDQYIAFLKLPKTTLGAESAK